MGRTACSEKQKRTLEDAVPRKSHIRTDTVTGNIKTAENRNGSKLNPSIVTLTESTSKASVVKASNTAPGIASRVATSTPSDSKLSNERVPPILTLEDFGLSFASGNGNTLQCCVIFAGDYVSTICFRCVPRIGKSTSWYEKLFAGSVGGGSVWTDKLKIYSTLPWHDKGVPKLNSRGKPIRLFVINTTPIAFDGEKIMKLGSHICEHLNALNHNKIPQIRVANNFYWLPTDGSVELSDITSVL